jgi:histidinol-phosphatase
VPPTLEDDLSLALSLADLADEMTMARVGAPDLVVETKPDMTPVSDADRAVELALRDRLAQERPDDAVVGEEYGASGGPEGASGSQNAGDAGARRWIIDPIDGTASYVRAMPTWSTLIALEAGGDVVLGVVSMPALGRRWWAAHGRGAFGDGLSISVSRVSRLADAQLTWSGIESWDEVGRADALLSLARACWRSRGIGDAWQYMLVAEGAAEIATDPEASLWDLAAVKVVVEEAGGRFTDLRGRGTAGGGSGLATNGLLHEAALAYVGLRA